MKKVIGYLIFILFFITVLSCKNNSDRTKSYYRSQDDSGIDKWLIDSMKNAYNSDDYPKALEYLERLVQIDSTNGEYYYKIGYCESGLLNSEKSTETYNKAIKYHYKIVDATFNIGTNYLSENDSLAQLYFEKCLTLDSNYQRAKVQLRVIEEHKKKVGHY